MQFAFIKPTNMDCKSTNECATDWTFSLSSKRIRKLQATTWYYKMKLNQAKFILCLKIE